MRRFLVFLVCFFSCLFLFQGIKAQNYLTDSAFYSQSVNNAVLFYVNSLGKNTHLFNGSEYIFNSHGITGHPFFGADQPVKGNIFYDGTLYPNVSIAYDLSRDEVFINNNPGQDFNLKLITERVRYFSILNHVFVRINQDDNLKGYSPATGFYDLSYNNGKITVLAKRKKQIEQAFKAEDSLKFIQYNEYLVKKNNAYYPVDSKGSLIDVFRDQKDKVKKYFRKSDLNFKKDPENAIVKTAEYYAQLKD
jgi:hypothetical protein